MTDGNLKLWDEVAQTDPTHTKDVAMGSRKFTAIDAYQQIHRATELWGPVGQGWGWSATFRSDFPGLIVCELGLWYKVDGQTCTVMSVGAKRLHQGEKPDDEAPKKALTDAITKGLSYLGFNADVFLGKFEDSKYKLELWLTRLRHELDDCETADDLASLKGRWRVVVTGWDQDQKRQAGAIMAEYDGKFTGQGADTGTGNTEHHP